MLFTLCITITIAFFTGFLCRGGFGKINYYRRANHFKECLDAARAEGVESGKLIGWCEATKWHDTAATANHEHFFRTNSDELDERKKKMRQNCWHLEKCLSASSINLPPFLK